MKINFFQDIDITKVSFVFLKIFCMHMISNRTPNMFKEFSYLPIMLDLIGYDMDRIGGHYVRNKLKLKYQFPWQSQRFENLLEQKGWHWQREYVTPVPIPRYKVVPYIILLWLWYNGPNNKPCWVFISEFGSMYQQFRLEQSHWLDTVL